MTNNQFPKILVLNAQSIYKNNATGITLRSILREIPEENLMELYRDNTRELVAERFDFESIQIPAKDMPVNYFVRKMMRLSNDYEKDISTMPSTVDTDSYKHIQRRTKMISLFKGLIESTFVCVDKELDEKIKNFGPDIIYTLGASEFILSWAIKLQKKYNTGIVLHYMDNWRETQYTFGKCNQILKKIQDKKLSYLEKKMRYGMTISQAMADAYHQKYGASYLPLMNVAQKMTINERISEEVVFVYAGGLHLGRDCCIKKIANQLEKIANCGANVKLIVYTALKYRGLLADSPFIELRDPVKHEEIERVYELADVLIHVESDNEVLINFTKYSMSTKISEYMMSGRPILCYAPSELASSKYISKHHAGICVDNERDLESSIKMLMEERNRKNMGDNGRKCAEKYHSVEFLRTTIGTVFCERVIK